MNERGERTRVGKGGTETGTGEGTRGECERTREEMIEAGRGQLVTRESVERVFPHFCVLSKVSATISIADPPFGGVIHRVV